jgi:hypothetical protein
VGIFRRKPLPTATTAWRGFHVKQHAALAKGSGRRRFHVEQDLKVLTSAYGDARMVAVLRRRGVLA